MSAYTNAESIQPVTALDAPAVFVSAGEQDNGYLAIDQVDTNVTLNLNGSSFGAIAARANIIDAISGPNLNGVSVTTTSGAKSPTGGQVSPPEKPITPPVPEPAAVALLSIGLLVLLSQKKHKE
ncbi:PEP-CTERM sorting domain-containing protein [Chitinibacter tainanensis]|uniref:PEP-CTERM sorting domain-containing protein n=1 Tax=Chitinibacter tainanensis TaxID=230667 RepID=UPI000555ADD7|nr:PEP-CTERM sorting domain-containing protein [Chitinibacter tainanensis]